MLRDLSYLQMKMEEAMAHSLNLTLEIKQDAETLAKLETFRNVQFPALQGKIAEVMKKSQILHFARVVISKDNKFIQVLTEYDGDRRAYTDFFREELPDVFGVVFSLAKDPFDPQLLKDSDGFFAYTKDKDILPVGNSLSGDPDDHFVFSAYGNLTVKQILAALGDKAPK